MKALQEALGSRYRLGSVVGEGATALVYRAQDERFDRPVAVKMLRPELSASVTEDRFLLEIETAARLQHPNILPIYDAGSENGLRYYVMPLIAGESLREMLVREPVMSWTRALRVTQQIADALGYAHEQHVLHRDVKPENILLHAGQAMIADFGIAKVLSGAGSANAPTNVTMPGMGIGTPAYMSPEQAFSATDVDGRADVYSLACVLHEMLDGRPPFAGETVMAILAQKATGTMQALREAGSGAPAHVPGVLRTAMAQDPTDRPASMRAFVQALVDGGAHAASSHPTAAVTSSASASPSLAVLPFTNIGGNSDDEFLGDGITEDLIHALGQVHGLRVMGRSSSFSFKRQEQDASAAGAALGVASVLSGSVRRAGSRIRLVVHLVDVATGFDLWSERFDRQFTDVFDLQDEITRVLTDKLRVQLLHAPGRAFGPRAAHTDAYQAFLRGRFEWNQRTPAALLRARSHLEEAVAIDPSFALGHAALADAFVTLGVYGVLSPGESMTAAERAVERALAIEPGLAEAMPARGSVRALHQYDWTRAEHEYRLAIIANPANATAHQWRAMHALVPQGRFDEAQDSLARALLLDPLSPAIAASQALVDYYARDYSRALHAIDGLLGRMPDFTLAAYFRGLALLALSRPDEASQALEPLAARAGDHAEIVSALGAARAAAGSAQGAAESLARLGAMAQDHYVSPVLRAQVLAALGRADDAFAALHEALQVRAVDLPLLAVRPTFDSLRHDARYNPLIEALGLRG